MSAPSSPQDKKGLYAPRFGANSLYDYLRPIWNTKRIVNETCMSVGEEAMPLLYAPSRILSVQSYNLDTTYQEGVDYEVCEGKLVRLPQGNIPYFALEEYYIPAPNNEWIKLKVEPSKAWRYLPDREYLYFGESDTFTSRQVVVTYETQDAWCGFVPEDSAHLFPRTHAKLKSGEGLHILFYGDSITYGCNASGVSEKEKPLPQMPGYGGLVATFLKETYGCPITYTNTAVCGHNSRQGLDEVESRVIAHAPDLVVLAFGANDRAPFTLAEHETCAREMITRIHAALPNTEILLVSPITPNPEIEWWCGEQHTEFWKGHKRLAEEFPFVAQANVTLLHLDVLKRKRYFDLTGNNVNHPTDFLHRIYAQTVLAAILGNGYTALYE